MKRHGISVFFASLLVLWLGVAPAWGVSKDMVQLQTQVQQLQEQMTAMQRSFDERMGVMKNLVEQDTDAVNKVANALNALQTTLQKQQSEGGSKTDQLSGQIQALNDTMDELKTRLAKVSKQLEDMQAAQQSLGAQQAQQQAQQQALAQAPPPDVLYNNAVRDYNGGKYDLSRQEFSDYIKNFPANDLASNSQFYLGEISYAQDDFKGAIAAYDVVIGNYPKSFKQAAALLKKGLAELELGLKASATRDLREVVHRYPGSDEGRRAEAKLREIGTAMPSRPARH